MGRAQDDGARRRRLEEALEARFALFERLVEAAKDYAIFMTDSEGRVSAWNEGAQRLFGYGEGEILGEDGSVLFTPEDRQSGAHELRAGEAAGRALARAVEDLVEFERRRSPAIEVELAVQEGVPDELPEEVCKGVLLVVREALVNARRHSSARGVRVALGATEDEIRLEVSDDGLGFDPHQSTESVGLGAMRERAALLSGRLEIFSEPAEGTRVPRTL